MRNHANKPICALDERNANKYLIFSSQIKILRKRFKATENNTKMETLIVYANPNMGGHCHAMLESVKTQLAARNEAYTLIDLNAQKYDPVLHVDELYTTRGTAISEQTKYYMDLIRDAKRLIFIYPVWWNSMPAIMKGFFDKVFISKFAFRYKRFPIINATLPVGLLKGRKAVVFVSTGGPNLAAAIFLGNRYKKLIKRDILGFCGIKTKLFAMHNCLEWNETKKKLADKIVARGLRTLF